MSNGTSTSLAIPERMGAAMLDIAEQVGGIAIMAGQILRRALPWKIDRYEFTRNMYRMGVKSLPILAATAFFVGAIMVIQAAPLVIRYNARSFVGWSAIYTTFREIGPLLMALMFNGRVGANNTAELGTMAVTEQLDALRALAIDPITYLVVPRAISIVIILTCLCIIGDFLAILGAMGMASFMLDVTHQRHRDDRRSFLGQPSCLPRGVEWRKREGSMTSLRLGGVCWRSRLPAGRLGRGHGRTGSTVAL